MNLTARYEFVTPEIESGAASRFVQPPEENTQNVMWWGESLLYAHESIAPRTSFMIN
jgi:hypothetical protein